MSGEVSVQVYVGRDKSLFAYCAELHAAERAVAAGALSVRLCGAASGHVAAAHVEAPTGGVLTHAMGRMVRHATASAGGTVRIDERMRARQSFWVFDKDDTPASDIPVGTVVPLVRALLGNAPMAPEDWKTAEWVLLCACPQLAREHLRRRLALYCDDPEAHARAELHRDVVQAAAPELPAYVCDAIEHVFKAAEGRVEPL
jgi:hypothetical protein